LKINQSLPILGLFFICLNLSFGQHQELQEKPKIWQTDSKNNADSTSLLAAFRSGTINGHFRYFLSSTTNRGELKDYIANAVGGGLRFETGTFHGFRVGVSGFYIFDAGSSDLSEKDESTGQLNRYEIGLFDITNPNDLNEINRLEEFFIKYQHRGTKITFGRQLLNTPFINLQDGRMRPTAVEGLWVESIHGSRHQFQLGWLYSIAPRSTSKWYDAGKSVGIFPAGVDINGVKSDYVGNIATKGIFLANYQFKVQTPVVINLWNMWVENVMNTSMIQADWERNLNSGKIYVGLQVSNQMKSGNGGNDEFGKAYYQNNGAVWTYGARLGWKNSKWDYGLNFNRISSNGRYLMPREWGRDYFFTFMPRERNEGLGDVTALLAKIAYTYKKKTTIQFAAGTYSLPDVKNYILNKYGLPSYHQINIDLRHKFAGLINGLEGQILWVHKINNGETYENPKYVIHKVDMHLLNVVLNFRF